MGCQSRVSFSLCADRQCRNGLADHSDHKFSRTLSRLFCGWLVGHVYHVRVVHRSDISRVGLVVDPWVLLVYTFAVLAASCFGGLGFQESVSGASSCLFCFNELLKDFFQCHVLIFSPSKSNWMSWSARPRVNSSRIMCSVWSTFLSQFWHVVV